MEGKGFFKTLVSCLNPDAYSAFSQLSFSSAMRHFGSVLLVTLILLTVFSAVKLPYLGIKVEDEFSKFTTLSLDVKMELEEDIMLDGLRVSENGTYDGEKVFITNKDFIRQKDVCILFPPACWLLKEERTIEKTEDYANLIAHKDELKNILMIIMVLMLPSLIIAYTIFAASKAVVFIILMIPVLLFVARLSKLRITLSRTILTALYASTIVLIADPINLLLLDLYYLHYGAAIAYAIIGVNLIGEKKRKN